MLEELPRVETLFLDGPAGPLEAMYRPGADRGRAALLCHPHPLHGGTMHNRVVFQFERAFARAGRATLRFNFRGAGRSTGEHDGGRGEIEDARAALAALLDRAPGASVDVFGYSFGCWVSWGALLDHAATRSLTGVGLPLELYDLSFARHARVPIAIVQGERDEFGDAARVRAFAASLPSPPRLFLVEDADHLFTRGYEKLLAVLPEVVAAVD